MDKQPFIVAFPPGNLSDVDRARLEEAGIIAVEAVDPEAIVHIQFSAPLVSTCVSGDDLLRAALSAGQEPANPSGLITAAGRAAHEFVRAAQQGDGSAA